MLRWPQLSLVLRNNLGSRASKPTFPTKLEWRESIVLSIRPPNSLPVPAPWNSYPDVRGKFSLVKVWVGSKLSFTFLAFSYLFCQELALLGLNFDCYASWYRSLFTYVERVCLWIYTHCAFVYFYICILHSNRDFMHRIKLFPPISLGLSFCWIIQLLYGLHGLLLDKFTTLSFPFHWNF